MQSQLSPSYQESPNTDEQAYLPRSPDSHGQQDSPGKKKSMMGSLKDKAKKFRTKVKSSFSPKEHGHEEDEEEEEEEGSGSSDADDDQADSNKAQVGSNEPSYQNQFSEEETKGDHGDIYTKNISGSDGFATHDILKDTPTQAQPDEKAPEIVAKKELNTDYSREPRFQGQESAGAFARSSPQTDSTAVAAGGPFVESVTEEERSSKYTAPKSSELSTKYDEQRDFVPGREPDAAPNSSELSTKYDEQADFDSGRELDTGYEAGSEKGVTQELLAPISNTAKSDLEDREEKDDATSGIQNEEKPLPDKEEIVGSSPPVIGVPTTELDTEAKPQTLTDRAYRGYDSAKGGIAAAAAAAAAAVGALGYGGASSEGGEQERELGNGDEVTEGPKDKSYLDLAREKVAGVKDTITGRLPSGKKEGPIASKLGYGVEKTEEASQEYDKVASADEGKADQKPSTESFFDTTTGAKWLVTPKSGYGTGEKAEEASQESDKVASADEGQKSYTQMLYETAAGAKGAVSSKLGYGTGEKSAEEASQESDKVASADEGQRSYTQMLYETAAGAKGAVASKLGYGGGGEERSEGLDSSSTVSPAGAAAARFSPGEEEKALSQLITDTVSTSATTVKDTLLSPFSRGTPSSSTISTETTRGTEEDEATSTNNSATSPTSEQSFVDRVSGVVNSILGMKINNGEKDEVQAAAAAIPPASQDITPESSAIQ